MTKESKELNLTLLNDGFVPFCRKCDSNSNMSKLFSCISVAVIACTHYSEICLDNIASKTFTPIDVREYCRSLFKLENFVLFCFTSSHYGT